MHIHSPLRWYLRPVAYVMAGMFLWAMVPADARAASSWSPTLLVNSESFQTIDNGDGSTDIELRFGQNMERMFYNITTQRFQFSRGLTVGGGITATGALIIRAHMSGSSLNVDHGATVGSTLSVSGATLLIGNVTGRGRFSGSIVHASTELRSSGSLLVEGTLSGGTIAGFGLVNCVSGNKLLWNATTKKFECATDTSNTYTAGQGLTLGGGQSFSINTTLTGSLLKFTTVSGSFLTVDNNASISGSLIAKGNIATKANLSGASLTVGGTFQWRGQTYTAPASQTANTYLKTDGGGGLTWSSATIGNGSGNIMSFHPEYPNAVYFSSGSTTVGQLAYSYDTSNKQNHYRWSSTKSTKQDYWVAVRVRVPDNFSSWDTVKPIELRYRTGSGQTQGSYLTAKILDTAGSAVTLTNGANLANTSWTTTNITGPEAAGTWTPKSMFTLLLKLAASTTTSSWFADAGYINFNFETTNP